MIKVETFLQGHHTPVELKVKYSTFPAGEEYVCIENPELIDDSVLVEICDASASTIMKACLIADAVKNINPTTPIIAKFGYFPYGRQDRACKVGESFSLKFFIEMLKLRFDRVDTFDPHSDVTRQELGYMLREDRGFLARQYKDSKGSIGKLKEFLPKDLVVISPDKGAVQRSWNLFNFLDLDGTVVECDKVRGKDTINIVIDSMNQNVIKNNKQFVISDDICDGGGTFIALAQRIREINPDAVLYLIISHGVFSKGFSELEKYYAGIYTVDNSYNNFRIFLNAK